MVNVTYVEHDGTEHRLVVESGLTVMEGAVKNGINGIVAQCGGACSCATCHVYVDEAWIETAGAPAGIEVDMLDCAWERRANSRLSCQLVLSEKLDGLVVRLPERQE